MPAASDVFKFISASVSEQVVTSWEGLFWALLTMSYSGILHVQFLC